MSGTRTPSSSNEAIEVLLHERLAKLESHFSGDMLVLSAPIVPGVDNAVRDAIEEIKNPKESLFFLLETGGGYAEVAQRIVDTIRHHYKIVEFIVPNHAMSAGTILVMSGDAIHMDYYSLLGPIDPQVQRPGTDIWVPALGYLKQFDRLIKKSSKGALTTAEMTVLVEKFDLAELYEYEQALNLSVTLLKSWLVKYKFKDWTETRTRKKCVTPQMKEKRAEEIAKKLNDTDHWHSHRRGISMPILVNDLNLRIEDFGLHKSINEAIKGYDRILKDYMMRRGQEAIIHSKKRYVPLG